MAIGWTREKQLSATRKVIDNVLETFRLVWHRPKRLQILQRTPGSDHLVPTSTAAQNTKIGFGFEQLRPSPNLKTSPCRCRPTVGTGVSFSICHAVKHCMISAEACRPGRARSSPPRPRTAFGKAIVVLCGIMILRCKIVGGQIAHWRSSDLLAICKKRCYRSLGDLFKTQSNFYTRLTISL